MYISAANVMKDSHESRKPFKMQNNKKGPDDGILQRRYSTEEATE